MTQCIPQGWGVGSFGSFPWGSGQNFTAGGPIPALAPTFDIYCVGPCGPMENILSFLEVEVEGDSTHLTVNAEADLVLSGGDPNDAAAWIFINTSVPQQFTFETTFALNDLPTSFANVASNHFLIGVQDAQGASVGLFFSSAGIGYCGYFRPDNYYNLLLDAPIELLPDSQQLTAITDYQTLRVVCDYGNGKVYVYLTETSTLPTTGHVLRYVLPVIPSSGAPVVPPDRTCISVRGTGADKVRVLLDSICLGAGAQVPNLPPIADAGRDQATTVCSVALLNGSNSFDPEKQALTYKWRLISAPSDSVTREEGDDGITHQLVPHPPPPEFTNRFYSVKLGSAHAVSYDKRILPGDVLVIDATPYDILSVGTDGDGFYVVISSYALPDDLSGKSWQLYRQKYLAGKTASKCSFFTDVAGFYKFDLRVHDGSLWSSASTTIVNAMTVETARGVVPDVSFLWTYLTDFYNHVTDIKPRFQTIWEALVQTVAGHLLHLWQIDYGKSLRDIPRQIQRKWIYFDTHVEEVLTDVVASQMILSGYLSAALAPDTFDLDGQQLIITSPFLPEALTCTFSGSALSIQDIVDTLVTFFGETDPRFTVVRIDSQDTGDLEGYACIRIKSPFHFSVSTDSTVDEDIFPRGDFNGALASTGATRIDDVTLKLPMPLTGVDVTNMRFLLLDNVAYTVVRLVSHADDAWPDQRIQVTGPLPAAVDPAATWILPDSTQTLRTDFYGSCVFYGDVAVYEVIFADGSEPRTVYCPVLGASEAFPNTLAVDLSPLAQWAPVQLGTQRILFHRVIRRTYLPLSPLIVDIPYLQPSPRIVDDRNTLRKNLDFFLESFRGYNVIRFQATEDADVWEGGLPPQRLWAENVYLDNRPTIEANFGLPVGVRYRDIEALPGEVDYLSAVRGIWYVLFNGPTIQNLRIGSQILLGLPFAEESGRIEEIRRDYSDTLGRITIRDTDTPTVVRTYTFPRVLEMETNPRTGNLYAVGDQVKIFEPLVRGVDVLDYVNDPTWFAGYVSQGTMLEVEKFFKFLVRIDSAAFSLPALMFVQALINRVKPAYTHPLFTVAKDVGDATVDITDVVEYKVGLELHDLAVSNGSYGMATMFDEPDPSPSAHAAETAQLLGLTFTHGALSTVPAAGFTYGSPKKVSYAGALQDVGVNITGSPAFSAPGYTAQLLINNEVVGETDFTLIAPTVSLGIVGTFAVEANDIVTVRLLPNPAQVRYPNITNISTQMDYAFTPAPTAPGGIQSRYDKSSNPADPDAATNEAQVLWGFDNNLLSPHMTGVAVVTMDLAAPTLPSYDMLLSFDGPTFSELGAYFFDSWIRYVPPDTGVLLHPGEVVLGGSGTISHVELRIDGGRQDSVDAYDLVLFVNDVEETTLSFTVANTGNKVLRYTFSPGLLLTPGDVLKMYLRHASASPTRPFFKKLTVALGIGTSWAFDGGDLSTPLPAGSYFEVRML